MQNKIVWLLISIILVYILFTANGITILKNAVTNVTTGTTVGTQTAKETGTIISGGSTPSTNTNTSVALNTKSPVLRG